MLRELGRGRDRHRRTARYVAPQIGDGGEDGFQPERERLDVVRVVVGRPGRGAAPDALGEVVEALVEPVLGLRWRHAGGPHRVRRDGCTVLVG
jgi:hypothetical protein